MSGIIHWLSKSSAQPAEMRLYDRLFTTPTPPQEEDDFLAAVNPESYKCLKNCFVEPALSTGPCEESFQFERLGYFTRDKDSQPEKPVFNKTVSLKETYTTKR